MAAESSVRIWQSVSDHITLDYATVRVHYEPAGERVRDRRGLLHAILPAGARYPSALTIGVLAEELTGLNCAGASSPYCVLEWLERMFRNQASLLVFVRGETLATDGSAITRNLAYLGFLDSLPEEYSGTLPIIGGGPEYVELRFHVTQDGRFTNFNSLGSYAAYSPARPGGES
jgi:hypothetical protein